MMDKLIEFVKNASVLMVGVFLSFKIAVMFWKEIRSDLQKLFKDYTEGR
jgi:hypothetical protein